MLTRPQLPVRSNDIPYRRGNNAQTSRKIFRRLRGAYKTRRVVERERKHADAPARQVGRQIRIRFHSKQVNIGRLGQGRRIDLDDRAQQAQTASPDVVARPALTVRYSCARQSTPAKPNRGLPIRFWSSGSSGICRARPKCGTSTLLGNK
jgi:hypothetical protein